MIDPKSKFTPRDTWTGRGYLAPDARILAPGFQKFSPSEKHNLFAKSSKFQLNLICSGCPAVWIFSLVNRTWIWLSIAWLFGNHATQEACNILSRIDRVHWWTPLSLCAPGASSYCWFIRKIPLQLVKTRQSHSQNMIRLFLKDSKSLKRSDYRTTARWILASFVLPEVTFTKSLQSWLSWMKQLGRIYFPIKCLITSDLERVRSSNFHWMNFPWVDSILKVSACNSFRTTSYRAKHQFSNSQAGPSNSTMTVATGFSGRLWRLSWENVFKQSKTILWKLLLILLWFQNMQIRNRGISILAPLNPSFF